MCKEEFISTFILGIIFAVVIIIFIFSNAEGYLKVKRYFKISLKEYMMLDNITQQEPKDSANYKLHTEILKRIERKEQQND